MQVNRIICLICLFLFFGTNARAGFAGNEILEIDISDPNLWNKIQTELSEGVRSEQIIGFFALGKEQLEFRAVREAPNEEKADDSEWLASSRGERLLIEKKALIGSEDIYGIQIKKRTIRDKAQFNIVLHFKSESFDKVSDVTSRFMKKRLGLVRGQSLIAAPIVQEALNRYSIISLHDFSSADIDTFKKGFLLMDQAALQEWNRSTIEWIEKKLQKEPDNTKLMIWLAREYFENDPRGCEKALDIIEKTMSSEPTQAPMAQHCYKLLRLYDRAIAFYDKFLCRIQNKEYEVDIRNSLVEIYGLKGELAKMIDEMEKNLQILKTHQLPSFDDIPEGPDKEGFLREMQRMKERAIKGMEALIEKAKSELHEKEKLSR